MSEEKPTINDLLGDVQDAANCLMQFKRYGKREHASKARKLLKLVRARIKVLESDLYLTEQEFNTMRRGRQGDN